MSGTSGVNQNWSRRIVLGAGLASAAAAPAFAQWTPAMRRPDPAVRVLDPSFARYRIGLAGVERLATGFRWAEGPVWMGDARCLLFSDIPNNQVVRWSESTGAIDAFRAPSNNSNGNARDRQGRLITCEHLTRRVTRTEYDGAITVIADRFEGKRLNSPNDVVVARDGAIWFTDPVAGISGFYEGEVAPAELSTNLYRVDPQTGAVALMADQMNRPNGLAFSPDQRILYVVEGGATPRNIHAFPVSEDGRSLGASRVLVRCAEGETPDGLRVDTDGNLWIGWGMGADHDGVRVINPAGRAIGHIALPERCANVCFGGRHRNRLFMTATSSLYSLYVNTQGAA